MLRSNFSDSNFEAGVDGIDETYNANLYGINIYSDTWNTCYDNVYIPLIYDKISSSDIIQ